MKLWNLAIFIAALLLSLISLALPAAQWASIPANPWAQIIAATTAIALGVCKLGFFPLAWEHLTRKSWLPGFSFAAFAVTFLIINVDATADLLDSEVSKRNQYTHSETVQQKRFNSALIEIETSIKTVNALMQTDLETGYRHRAYKQLGRLDDLRKQHAELRKAELLATQTAIASPVVDFGVSLKALPGGGSEALISGSLLVALCVHLGCVLAILACCGWSIPSEGLPRAKPALTVTENRPLIEREKTVLQHELNNEQKRLSKEICSGLHGQQPGVKALVLNKAIPGGHRAIKQVFDFLVNSGDLRKEGQRFQLIQSTF